jgi:hypothetical protein
VSLEGSVPYRAPDPPEPDREMPAIAELERRVRRARTAFIVAVFVVVLPLCVVGYDVVQELQFAANGYAFLWLNAGIGCGLPLLVGFQVVARGVPRLVRALVDRWLPEIAARHGVPVENLAEFTTHLR